MTAEAIDEILGEHALRDGELDRLGFGEIADRIAKSIADRASKDGLVIGIEGRWGSGKSSLIHLIERALDRCAEDVKPTVINFRPWLVGNRDALLTSLFNELAEKIARVNLARGDASQITAEKAKKAAEAVRKFGRALGKAGDVVEVVGEAWGPLKLVGKGMKALGGAAAKDNTPADLSALKAEITKGLIDLKHRFIITVDDVDRLEPAEAVEVLRLVRSVADFPNIVYLLCYDSARLAEAIQKGANVEDGLSFLEKIVQLTVMIPTPEPFELRQWFEEEASALLGDMPYEVQERLRTVIDQEGGTQLRTPRSVVRTLDSLRFFWPAVKSENIDVADLVWLQLIKDGSPALYRWIQDYVASASAISFGTASVTDSSKEKRLKALLEAADEGQLSDVLYRHMFSDILPGVEASYADDGPPVSIHEKVNQRDIQTAIEGRRLASPDHYRIYFSLIGPSHAITQAGFDRLWAALDASPEEAGELILELHNQKAVGALRKSDVLFERLKSMDASLWTPLRAKNLLLGMGQMMDSAYRRHPSEDSFIVSSWDRAERLVPVLYAPIPAAERPEVNRQLFAEGSSLGWLTSIFRREIFAHGRYGSRTRQPEEWLLPEAEFEAAATIMVERYRSMTIDEILATPRALHILFAWNQAGDIEGPKNLIAASTQDDEQLVRVLGAFVSSINSSDRGRYAVLKRENMEPFMDFDAVVSRLTSIARSAEDPIKRRAAELIGYVDDGKDF